MRALLISAFLTPLCLSLAAQPEAWLAEARAYVNTTDDTGGLSDLILSQDLLNTDLIIPQGETLTSIYREGWRAPHPEIEGLIASQRPALDAAIRAAEADHITFPAWQSSSSPVMNFLFFQLLAKLMAAEARMLAAQGQLDLAAERAVQLIRLSNHLNVENVGLIQHLIGVAGMNIGFTSLSDILIQPGISEETLEATWEALCQVARVHVGMEAAFETEGRCMLVGLQEAKSDPALLRDFFSGSLGRENMWHIMALQAALEDFNAFQAEHQRVWGLICENASLPAWERESFGPEWIEQQTDNPLFQLALPNFLEAVTREEVTEAKLSLCMALCALRLDDEARLEEIVDPFTGEPVRVESGRVWSLGPDQADQGANLVYDPTNGTMSPGDIVENR
ncbi:hypothetical protein JXA47_16005 [Candidatus Sumerlaeota bacterium]|nr:hypothetical protein [Candidatus Sumerlaeota bacterium]